MGAVHSAPMYAYKTTWLNNSAKYFAFADARENNFSNGNYHNKSYNRLYPRHSNEKAINIVFGDGHVENINDPNINVLNIEIQKKISPRVDGHPKWEAIYEHNKK
jgi:prepilin-type processing-associated H-X9-DG protein